MSAVEIDPPLQRGTEWQEFAACSGRLELFFGKVAERPQARERREAKARKLCDTCVVRQPCRQFARDTTSTGSGAARTRRIDTSPATVTAPIGVRVRLAREEAAAG
jgi:WhiB family transcriptional regulator, redox-sensing transcriptional regulator